MGSYRYGGADVPIPPQVTSQNEVRRLVMLDDAIEVDSWNCFEESLGGPLMGNHGGTCLELGGN